MKGVHLPDCSREVSPRPLLDLRERAELIRRLGAGGTGAIPAFIEAQASRPESGISQRLAGYRRVLEAQAKRIIASKRDRIRIEMRRLDEDIRVISQEARSPGVRLDAEVAFTLDDFIRKEVLAMDASSGPGRMVKEGGLLARVRSALLYILHLIAAYLTRLWRALCSTFSRKRRSPGKRRRKIAVGLPGGLGRTYAAWRPGLSRGDVERILRSGGHSEEHIRAVMRVDPRGASSRAELHIAETLKKKRRDIERKRRDIEREVERRERERRRKERVRCETLERRRETLLKEEKELDNTLREKSEQEARARVHQDLVDEMASAGYLRVSGEHMEITPALIERYAHLVFLEEAKSVMRGGTGRQEAHGICTGVYEKGRARTGQDLDRMDILTTYVNTRLRYPGRRGLDEGVAVVSREVHGSVAHVVILMDKSGSMGENMRLENAKRAVMALYRAVKSSDRRNIVDILVFDNDVYPLDLYGVWECEPGSFTNTGEALRKARDILATSRADRRIIYLITDGLPESYTDISTGRVTAGDLERSMAYAESAALELRRIPGLRMVTILLEAEASTYVRAAERISSILRGVIYTVEGRELARDILRDYLAGEKGADRRGGGATPSLYAS